MKRVPFSALPVRLFKHLTSSESHQGIDRRAYLAAGFTVVLWASAFPGIRVALQNYTPAHVALIRYVTASLVLVVYALFVLIRLPRFRDLPGFALLGLIATFRKVTTNYWPGLFNCYDVAGLLVNSLKDRQILYGRMGI